MKLIVKKGRTSLLARIFIQDSSSTVGAGLTGLTNASSGLVCYRARDDDGNAAATAISLSAGTRGTWSSGGFKEKDATNMPGWYELGIPDAAIASGSESVDIMLKGATNMAPCNLEIQLVAYDPQDSVRAGLTAMPNAAAGASGGLPLSVDTSGRVDVLKINGTSQTARDIGASVLLSAGTGTGQLDFTSGVVKSNLAQILGTALTETAGFLAAGFKAFFNIASPVLTVASINQTGDSYARVGAPVGASISADIAAVKSDSAAIKTQTDKLTFTVANQIDANVLDWKSAAAPAMTGDAYARLGAPAGASISADIAAIPGDVWDVTLSGHLTSGTTGHALNAAGAAGDPWSTALPGAYSSGEAGYLVGTYVDAAVSSRLATSGYTAPPTADANADALLDRTDGVESGLTLRQWLRLSAAVLFGKVIGMDTTTVYFRDTNDTTNRVTSTVDKNGNRSQISTDPN